MVNLKIINNACLNYTSVGYLVIAFVLFSLIATYKELFTKLGEAIGKFELIFKKTNNGG